MNFSIRKVNALLKKEIKDFSKNLNVSIMCVLPIMASFVFSIIIRDKNLGDPANRIAMLTICLSLNLVLISSFVIAMLIAEEKEKNTLRTLMLSAVSPWEFLAGKAFVTLLVSEVINIATFLIIGFDTQFLAGYMLITTLVVVIMIVIGAIIGIASPNQMATGVVGMPVLIVFPLVPMLAEANDILKTIAEFLPNHNMNLILASILKGENPGSGFTLNAVVILAWIIVSAALFIFAYNKRGLDK